MFFACLAQGRSVYWESCENYQKRSLRNRYYILGANGAQVLSIPLKGGKNNQCPIQEVRISYSEPWQELHVKSIHAAYGKSAFFEYYIEDFTELIANAGDSLWSFNWRCLCFCLEKLSMDRKVGKTKNYETVVEGTDYRKAKINDFCVSTGHLYTNLHGQYGPSQEKPLSILDLMFCLGPEGKMVLKQINIDQ
jgi:hypothetical protein